jgi:hypothetical protein
MDVDDTEILSPLSVCPFTCQYSRIRNKHVSDVFGSCLCKVSKIGSISTEYVLFRLKPTDPTAELEGYICVEHTKTTPGMSREVGSSQLPTKPKLTGEVLGEA